MHDKVRLRDGLKKPSGVEKDHHVWVLAADGTHGEGSGQTQMSARNEMALQS
jgi:hypothetical protein